MLSTIYKEYKNKFEDKPNLALALIYAIVCYFRMPHFRVIVLIREMQKSGCKLRKEMISKKLCIKYGIEVGRNAKIGHRLNVRHLNGIVIGDGAIIGDNVTLYHNVTLGQRKGFYPRIKDGVTIYPGSIILGGVSVGKNSIILANSVVLEDVPEECIVAGNPATVVKSIDYTIG
ncbi:serine O-acetyltransferase [Bacillus sp. OV166]|uniref:serine O-acetyltransferase n=1 Tax=Bacillus sp. OV166 TaxID=1882763 RepID=UPI000A2AADF7|nr:serine O-acetyltransferase [Bacillus sp. OV166]SMQ85071.1 serine O-acetyltransferase [Bacillus sp. OV166]